MDHEIPRHEKIRFRREEIADLGSLPSAADPSAEPRRKRSISRVCVKTLGVGATFLGLIVGALFVLGQTGIGTEKLRVEAEKAIERFAGFDVDATMAHSGISIDGGSLLAVRMEDVNLKNSTDGAEMLSAGEIRFGMRPEALLRGSLALGSATISDARIMTGAFPTNDAVDWTRPLRNGDGLIDPDKLAERFFLALGRTFDAVQRGATSHIEMNNVEFMLPEDGRVRVIHIQNAVLEEAGAGKLQISAMADIDGRNMAITGTAVRDEVSQRVSDLQIEVVSEAGQGQVTQGEAPREADLTALGAVNLSLKGSQGIGGEPSRIAANFSMKSASLDMGKPGVFSGDLDLETTLLTGSGKIEINRLAVVSGRSRFNFNGAIGPRPHDLNTGQAPAYRYELVSSDAILSPEGSSEPAFALAAKLQGTYSEETRVLSADEIAVKSSDGNVAGSASIELPEGKSPGVSFNLKVADMPVSEVKQLWPWFSARGAHDWVRDHLFGGQVTQGELTMKTEPGRLGNGIPLSDEEIFGAFTISGTRFDTTGQMPPVRDADGTIRFGGRSVDVTLSKGSAYLPDGGRVDGRNGKLTISDSRSRPVIGKLDIDVAGEATAVAQLASYEPINAFRRLDLKGEDFSGEISGNVKADIPLQKGVDRNTLDWLVTLDYKNLSIAKPLDNQKVTEANGTITIDPEKALIVTKARLNGIPADLNMIEPLRETGPERDRDIKLVLDDKTRNAIAPGLSNILSGTVTLDVVQSAPGKQTISADLSAAQLMLPWVGWSKGSGIPATAEFVMEKKDNATNLSNFKLSGDTFGASGSIALSGTTLSTATFDKVSLNRGDNFAVSVKRSGGSYAVSVNGSALDARPLIKRFTSKEDGGGGSLAGAGSFSLNADVQSVTGFNGENLSNMKLDYRGSGFQVSATSSSGGVINAENGSNGNGRSMRMQAADAGAILRFLNMYEHMQGGTIKVALAGAADGPMRGQIDTQNFRIVNEPRLASLVSTTPPGDNRSLNQTVGREIDVSRADFERGYAQIERGDGFLRIANGVLRGPQIGTTFQGTLYDQRGNMSMTGTFMPAYGVNRIFGEIPLFGLILGNGRDRGLIGVTYKLEGNAKSPKLQINPLSAIAPGIFRSIFEFQ